MVLVDASSRWSHVCLLSTRNVAFARLLAQIIRLRAHFPNHLIKLIYLDNASEFTSKTFDEYCKSVKIDVEHPSSTCSFSEGISESLIKHLQVIARTLLFRYNYQFLYGNILFISDPLLIIITCHYNL